MESTIAGLSQQPAAAAVAVAGAAQHAPGADLLVTAICGFVVAFYAWERYNTPETNRVSTTRWLFLFTGAGYISASLILFLLLSEVLLRPGVLLFLDLEGPKKIIADYFPPPVLAAVLLTVLLPNTPIVSSAHTWLLERFQTWGRIPQGVRNLADELTPQALQLGPADLSQLREWIEADGEVPDDLAAIVSADAPETSRGGLARVLRLYVELLKLETAPAYRNAFRSTQDSWHAIKEDFHVFVAESQAFFVLFERLTPLEGTAGEAALFKAKKCYRDICRDMHRDMTEFLAQLLLMVEGSDQRIMNRLQSIGFATVAQPGPQMQVGPFLFMGAMMIVGMLGVVSVFSPHGHVLSPPLNAILIGTTRTIGILAAILPKLRWSSCRPDSRGNPPYLAWLGWASAAGIAALLIDRATISIYYANAGAALDFVNYPLRPLAPMALATSLVISILCDIDLGLGEGWARRVTEGLLAAIAMAVSILICTRLLDLPASTAAQGPWMPSLISAALGFVSGFFAPYLYRRARDDEPVLQAAASHAV